MQEKQFFFLDFSEVFVTTTERNLIWVEAEIFLDFFLTNRISEWNKSSFFSFSVLVTKNKCLNGSLREEQ